jgi:predicted kinase
MKTCIILVGPMCSGKSTYIKENCAGYRVISNDININTLPSTSYVDNYYTSATKKHLANIAMNQTLDAIKNNENIVIDNTNITAKTRNKTLCRFSKTDRLIYRIVCVVLPYIDEETFIKRNLHRSETTGKYISLNAFRVICESYQIPLMSEGFDEIIFL